MGIFAELADKRLYGCIAVVGFIKPKKLRYSEYKLCLNERTILRLLDICQYRRKTNAEDICSHMFLSWSFFYLVRFRHWFISLWAWVSKR